MVFYAHEETNCVSKIWVVGSLVFVSGPFTFHVGPRCLFGIHLFDFHVLVSKDTIDNFRYSSNDVYIHTDPWMLFGFAVDRGADKFNHSGTGEGAGLQPYSWLTRYDSDTF